MLHFAAMLFLPEKLIIFTCCAVAVRAASSLECDRSRSRQLEELSNHGGGVSGVAVVVVVVVLLVVSACQWSVQLSVQHGEISGESR